MKKIATGQVGMSGTPTFVTIVTIATIATFYLRLAQGYYLYVGGVRIIFSVPPVEDTAGVQGFYLYGG